MYIIGFVGFYLLLHHVLGNVPEIFWTRPGKNSGNIKQFEHIAKVALHDLSQAVYRVFTITSKAILKPTIALHSDYKL